MDVPFFAIKISKRAPRLLILGLLAGITLGAQDPKSLNLNKIEEEFSMLKSRSEVPEKDRWNVEALYADIASWKADLDQYKGKEQGPRWPELAQYKGRLKDPEMAAAFIQLSSDLDRKLSKLYTYAHLRMDEDLGNDDYKGHYGQMMDVLHDFQLEMAWVEPEILSMSDTDLQNLISHTALKPYRFHVEKIARMRPHTLSPELEELLALSSKALDASHKAFGALYNADMTFKPAVDAKGQEHVLSNGSYVSYLRSPDRVLRKSAFENLYAGFEAHANTFCELLQGQVQSHLFHAKARHFDSCLEAALFTHRIEPSVYENLIASIHQAIPLMHEYMALRKQILGVDELHSYDIYAPLVEEVNSKLSYTDACQSVLESVAPLGKEYHSHLQKGLIEERWVDVYENARKRSGAYSSGCYDSMPYILLNYQGTLNDVLTLAHEAGHSMHSLLSRLHQPYIYSQYPIFVAEVASTFNEQLLLKHLKSKVKSKKELAYLINYEIEGIRGTIFRQTLFAEFELQIHRWVEEGTPLTPTLLRKFYTELNQKYYGPHLVLDPQIGIEWARIPHFYYNFYVYQYATGLSAALALFEKASHSEKARDLYLEFLSSGGKQFPIDLLEKAGVDMRKSDAVNAAMKHFEKLLQEFRACLQEI